MEVILIKDVAHLGAANELVKVKNGYARNYLIPKKMAVEANKTNKGNYEERQRQLKIKEEKMMSELNNVMEKLKESPLQIGAKSGTSGKIFGSITSLQLSRAIKKETGYEIDRKKITFPDNIKELGTFTAVIDFGNEKVFEVNFEVVPE